MKTQDVNARIASKDYDKAKKTLRRFIEWMEVNNFNNVTLPTTQSDGEREREMVRRDARCGLYDDVRRVLRNEEHACGGARYRLQYTFGQEVDGISEECRRIGTQKVLETETLQDLLGWASTLSGLVTKYRGSNPDTDDELGYSDSFTPSSYEELQGSLYGGDYNDWQREEELEDRLSEAGSY